MPFGRISSRNASRMLQSNECPFYKSLRVISSTSHFFSKIVEDIREAFLEEIRWFATFVIEILRYKAKLFYISNIIATYEIFQFQKIGSTRKRHGLWQQHGKN